MKRSTFNTKPAERVRSKPIPMRKKPRATMCLTFNAPARASAPASTPAKRAASAAEKRHMDLVAQAGCVLCRLLGTPGTPAEVHHLREGQGMAQRASNFLTVGLCPEHHRGASGLHGLGERGFYTRYLLTELDLLAMTIQEIAK